jgi:hypothetical protein
MDEWDAVDGARREEAAVEDHAWLLARMFPALHRGRLVDFAREYCRVAANAAAGGDAAAGWLEAAMQDLVRESQDVGVRWDAAAAAAVVTPSLAMFYSRRKYKYELKGGAFNAADPLEQRARVAEGLFKRMLCRNPDIRGVRVANYLGKMQEAVRSVDVVENPRLEGIFLAKKEALSRELGRPAEELLLFHGTAVDNVDDILRDNFDLAKCRRMAHGKGIYFSEFPSVSMGEFFLF